jgi:hypothetical protein
LQQPKHWVDEDLYLPWLEFVRQMALQLTRKMLGKAPNLEVYSRLRPAINYTNKSSPTKGNHLEHQDQKL